MNRTGETVFLNASFEALFRRLKVAKAKRPLLADKTDEELAEVIRNGLASRMGFYGKAKHWGWQAVWAFMGKPNIGSRPIIWRAVSR